MDYTKINKTTQNLQDLLNTKPVHTEEEYEEVNVKVYKIGGEEGLYVKVHVEQDSYEDRELITGFELVRAVEKTILTFE